LFKQGHGTRNCIYREIPFPPSFFLLNRLISFYRLGHNFFFHSCAFAKRSSSNTSKSLVEISFHKKSILTRSKIRFSLNAVFSFIHQVWWIEIYKCILFSFWETISGTIMLVKLIKSLIADIVLSLPLLSIFE
jgi:hypothetical protein